MAVAAVVAWLVARQLDEAQSFIAPYAAVFMMSGTVYRSLADAARQVTTVVLGVLVAFVVAVVVPWQAVALGVAVFLGMVIGRWQRLGREGIWVAVVALLMITFGTADDLGYLFVRAGEALFGALVGVAVHVLILPPLYLRHVGRAVVGVSEEIGELIRQMARALREEWSTDDAAGWRRRARALETVVRHAEEASGYGRESARFNPRRLWSRAPRLSTEDSALAALYEVAAQLQHITETLLTSREPDGGTHRTGSGFDATLAGLLSDLADAVTVYQNHAGERRTDGAALEASLGRVRQLRASPARTESATEELRTDWSVHGAVLLAVERAYRALLAV